MNVDNPLFIEVLTTLDRIDRMNKAIAFHKQQPEPDYHAIQNYERLKDDFARQLVDLLNKLDIPVQLPVNKAA